MRLKRIGLAVAICATVSLGASAGPAFASHILPTTVCDSADDIPAGCYLGGGASELFRVSAATPLASLTTPEIKKPATPAIIVLFVDLNNDGDFDDSGEAIGAPGTGEETLLPPQELGGTFRITYAHGNIGVPADSGTAPRIDFVACHAPEQGLHVRVSRTASTRNVDVEFDPTGPAPPFDPTGGALDEPNTNPQAFQTGFCVDT